MSSAKFVWEACVTLKDGVHEDPFSANLPPERRLVVKDMRECANSEVKMITAKPEKTNIEYCHIEENFNNNVSNNCFVSESFDECTRWYSMRMRACADELSKRIKRLDDECEIAISKCENFAYESERLL